MSEETNDLYEEALVELEETINAVIKEGDDLNNMYQDLINRQQRYLKVSSLMLVALSILILGFVSISMLTLPPEEPEPGQARPSSTPKLIVLPTAIVQTVAVTKVVTATPLPTSTPSPTPSQEQILGDINSSLALSKLVTARQMLEPLLIRTMNDDFSLDEEYKWDFEITYGLNLLSVATGELESLNLIHPLHSDPSLEAAVTHLKMANGHAWVLHDAIVLPYQNSDSWSAAKTVVEWEVVDWNGDAFFAMMNKAFQELDQWQQDKVDLDAMWEGLQDRSWQYEVETDVDE